MMSTDTVPRKKKHIFFQEDGSSYIVNPYNGLAYQLNSTGLFIWQLIDGQRSVDEIVALLQSLFPNICSDKIKADIDSFIRRLIKDNFISFDYEPASQYSRYVTPAKVMEFKDGYDYIVYDPNLVNWVRLNRVEKRVFDLLKEGSSLEFITKVLCNDVGVSYEEAHKVLEAILIKLKEQGLLFEDAYPQEGVLAHPLIDHPLVVYYVITYGCNFSCRYCYADAGPMKRDPNELSTQEAYELVDQVVECEAKTLVFTGGEPLIRRDLFNIASYAKQRGLKVSLITNGWFVDEHRARLIAGIFDHVRVSLDSVKQDVNDFLRNSGSYKRAIKAIHLLLKNGVQVGINTTVTKLNLKEVPEVRRLAKALGVKPHNVMSMIADGRGQGCHYLACSPKDVAELWRSLASEDKEDGLRALGLSLHKRFVRRTHCGMGISELSVAPDGSVYPCRLLHIPALKCGNIREKRLLQIYRESEVLKRIRSIHVEQLPVCSACYLRYVCGGGCRAEALFGSGGSLTGPPDPRTCAVQKTLFLLALPHLAKLINTRYDSKEGVS